MARNQQDTRIPVYRSGIPLALGGPRVRQTTQLPVRAGTRPTALAGLTANWPTAAERKPSPASSSSTHSTPSDSSTALTNRIPEPNPLPVELSAAHLGREVIVGGTKAGILRFFGTIPFDSGLFCGVELHEPEGLNDGCVRGIRLFDCEPLHGVLAPLRKVSLAPPGKVGQQQQKPHSTSPHAAGSQLPVLHSPSPLLPSGAKRQRTNAYESEAVVSPVLPPPDALEDDEVSTPREEVIGEGSTDERWSSEEVTPPAEQAVPATTILRPGAFGEKRETPKEENEINSIPKSLPSFSSPITQRTLEWTSAKVSEGGSGGSIVSSGLTRHPRSISDGSIVEMAGVISTSTPSTAGGPLVSRCGTGRNRCPNGGGGNNSNIRQQQQQQQQQLQQQQLQHQQQQLSQQHCSSDCVFSQRNGDDTYGVLPHCGEACTCERALSKHSSFEMDESLGILTPDQMLDFTVCMEGYGRTPSIDDIKRFEEGVAFPADHFGRAAETTATALRKGGGGGGGGFVPEDSAGFPEELEALSPAEGDEPENGAESPSLPTPGELVEDEEEGGKGEAMEGGDEAPAALGGHSDEEEAQMDDDEEEEVKDVMGEPCVADGPSSISGAPPARSTQVAPCFVASVTSITSIDPGYQGDGEWSRPASRADNSPGSSAPAGIGVNFGIPVDVLKLKIDTMTDSDFYSDTGAGGTESDADHEEAVREGAMAPGDRRAQVIDGTLYGGMGGSHGGPAGGGSSSHQQPTPRCFAAVMTSSTATTTEEMESSGVFSDLDRRADMRISFHSQAAPRPSSAQGVSSSAAESSDVPQSPLEELPEDPKKDATFTLAELEATKVAAEDSEDGGDMRVEMEVTLVEGEKMDTSSPPAEISEEFTVLKSQQDDPSLMSCDASPNRTVTVSAVPLSPTPRPNVPAGGSDQNQPQELQSQAQQQQQQQQTQPQQQQQQQQQEQPLPGHGSKQKSPAVNVSPPKKHKMPKRNVASKIKAMIESSASKDESVRGEDGEGSSRRQQSQRPGRWDAIMSKIAAGQAEQRTSRPRLREVKSRVMASIGTPTNTSRNSTTNEEGTGTVRAKKTFISNATRARRGETRRARARALDMSSLRDATCAGNAAAPPGEVGDSLNPSVHSSMSDVSLSRGAVAKASNSSRSSKKREADRSASPFSDGSSNSGASNIPRPMRPHLGAIPRQPSHPQRERTRDKTASTNALNMASSSSSAAVLRRNQRTSHLTSSSTPSAKRVNAGQRRSLTAEKGTTTEMKAPSSRKPATRHLSSGTQVQKPAPLRDSNRLGGGVVSKNGGPANNSHGNGTRGNAVVLLQRQHIQLATAEAPPSEVMVETAKSPPPPKTTGPPPVPPKLLEELKQSATRIEALLVLIQYLVVDLDAFSTPSLKKAVEEYKTEAINTKLNLDEAVASCQRLIEEAGISEVRHKENIDELIRKNEESRAELEARMTSQVEETQCRYEEELKRRERLNNRNMEALLEDLKLYAERAEKAEKKVEDVEKQIESLMKEKEEILARENDLKQLSSRLQSEISDLVEKLRKENVIKAGDCGKHRDEIQSLQAVLDLRTKELHDHRKKTEEYRQKSEALNSALARNAALQARVEDLEAQLQRKSTTERKLQEKVRHLSENVERECRQNEQLALENEVLEWKINESSKLMASFSGQSDMSSSMTGSMMASSSPSSDRRSISTMAISLGSPDSPPNFMFPRFSPRLSPKSPFSDVSGTIELEEEEDDMEGDEEEEDEEEEIKVGEGGLGEGEEEEEEDDDDKLSIEPTPITPKVRTLVEKNESISWLVEMEEVIPASSLTSHIQSAAMRRAAHHGSPQSSPLNLLPQMIPELPNSPSTSPTSSDPSSSLFRGGKGASPPHSAGRRVAVPPAKKTRPERGKLAGHGMLYSSTPQGHHLTTSASHGHHHRHHGRYHHHHQPRSTSRLPPSDSPLCSARSRSVSTDSESLDAEEASAAANARLAELKAWRGGAKAFASSSGERVSPAAVQEGIQLLAGDSEKKEDPGEKGGDWEMMNGGGCGDGSRLSEGEGYRASGSSPRSKPSTPMGDRDSPSKNGSPFCEFGEDFSDQSPFHGKFEVIGTSLNPMEDSSSSVENMLEPAKKSPSPPPPPPLAQNSPGAVPATFLPPAAKPEAPSHQLHHHHHHHYQPRHVLSSLCAHPHLSIKESAGEAMISEEISDDTQGESDEEDRAEEGKLLEDSEDDEEVEVGVGGEVVGAIPDRCAAGDPADAATPSAAEQRAVAATTTTSGGAAEENGSEGPKCNGAQDAEPAAAGNTLKLGQQVLSSSTPDSSHFAHTDSSVMDLSWSEDLDLMPSESEV